MKYGKIIEGNVTLKIGDDISETEQITGGVDVYENAKLSAPALTSIGGWVDVRQNAKLSIGAEYKQFDETAKSFCLKFNFECFLKAGFLFADNILAKIISNKTSKNNTNVYKIQICGQTKISYCIEVEGIFSHGATIKEAKDSLLYKISDRDTSKYDNYTLDTVISFEDAVKMYRCITGACEGGTRHFVENVLQKRKKKYTVREVIEETKGQYNNYKLQEFFKVAV